MWFFQPNQSVECFKLEMNLQLIVKLLLLDSNTL